MNIKKAILQVMQAKLNEFGYFFDKDLSLDCLFVFINKSIGFGTGLYISKLKWNNVLFASLRISPTDVGRDLFYIAGTQNPLEYDRTICSTPESMNEYLYKMLEAFMAKGHQWIVDNSIKEFNLLEVYEQTIDRVLGQYSLKRVYTDEDLLHGGKAIYEKDSFKIIFDHNKFCSRIECIVDKSGKPKTLSHIFNKGASEGLYTYPGFITKNEYISILEEYISCIKQNYSSDLLK